ncbi:hypothetical protein SAURM35S_06182 [Streptomyces aurantiogriseus]
MRGAFCPRFSHVGLRGGSERRAIKVLLKP